MTAEIGGAEITLISSVAELERLPESMTRTTNVFVPTSTDTGVPVNVPLLATLSHAGPLAFAKVIASPLGSVAFVAIVPEYAWPAFTSGLLKGLLANTGGALLMMAAISIGLSARL